MVVPFWELQQEHEGKEKDVQLNNGFAHHGEEFDALNRHHSRTGMKQFTVPVVQRRNLTYIKMSDRTMKKNIIKSTGIYAFHLLSENQHSVESGLIQNDFVCPLCSFDSRALPHVWIHLKTFHSGTFSFQHRTTPDNQLHILAKPLKQHKPEARPPKGTSELIYFETLCRYKDYHNFPNQGSVKPQDLITLLPPYRVSFPDRPYYHPETGCVLTLGQWLHETEHVSLNPEWQRKMENGMIDEFSDVLATEKAFLKLWNGYMANGIMFFPDLLPQLVHFVEKFAKAICEQDLNGELLAHLMNMWDHGHISRQAMHWLCRRYSELIHTDKSTVRATKPAQTLVCMMARPMGKRKFAESS
ncbi:hypothetical protein MPSEU_000216300 [Mayamaea pseudoterrestris]|nr:hypothetical protein MPSEU_000216300 [Mayamaea pseudoterrestris]